MFPALGAVLGLLHPVAGGVLRSGLKFQTCTNTLNTFFNNSGNFWVPPRICIDTHTHTHTHRYAEPGLCSRYSDSIRVGRSGDRIPVGARFPAPHQTDFWGQTSLLFNGYRVFHGSKAAGAWRWASTPSSAEVKERVQLYSTPPLGLRGLFYGELHLLPSTGMRRITTFRSTTDLRMYDGGPIRL